MKKTWQLELKVIVNFSGAMSDPEQKQSLLLVH